MHVKLQHVHDIVKVSIVGVGMRSHAGVASKMFTALAKEGINILMISTSEIKISVIIEEKLLRACCTCTRCTPYDFGLDRETGVNQHACLINLAMMSKTCHC